MKKDAKMMAVVLTQAGFMKWATGKRIEMTDVKPEYQAVLASNFIAKVKEVKGE